MGDKSYNAQAWKDSDEESQSGGFVCADQAARFTGEARAIDLEYEDLELEIRGGKRPCVEFSNPEKSDWTVNVPGHGILTERALRGRTPIRRQIEEYEDSKDGAKRLLATVLFFVGFIGLSAFAGVMVEAAMPKMVGLVPQSYEKQMTEEAMPELLAFSPSPYEATNTVAQLHTLLNRICPKETRGEYEFKLHLLESPIPNAMAMPAGTILVYTGFLEQADSTEEVAGVLAHEVAHVMKRHGLRKTMASAGPSLIFDRVLGSDAGMISVLAAGSSILISQGFSREYESEADDVAFDYLVAAGIDPRGLETFLSKLAKIEGDLDAFRSFLSHPPSPERVAALHKRWQNLKTKPTFEPLAELDFQPPKQSENPFDDMVDKMLGL